MKKELEKIFFKSLIEAIVNEECELNELFEKNTIEYQKVTPYGVSCLYETTYVYLTLKQLLKNKFPLLVSWEHPYPNNKFQKADLALLNDSEIDNVNSFVEFKIWKSEDGHEIKLDVEKLKNKAGSFDQYIVAIDYNTEIIKENAKFLNEKIGLEVIEKTSFITSFYDWEKRNNKQVTMNIYFAKVK